MTYRAPVRFLGVLSFGVFLLINASNGGAPETRTVARLASEPVKLHACNSVAYAQIPSHLDMFIGRIQATDDPVHCAKGNPYWTLGLFRMDWASKELTLVKPLFMPPVRASSSIELITGYDPHVVEFNGETWVGFECAGHGIKSVAVCIAPFDPETSKIDLDRLTVPIDGKPPLPPPWISASVPKLLSYKGHLYLYWSVVEKDAQRHFVYAVTQRGAELVQESNGSRRLWVKNSGNVPVYTQDERLTVEVMKRPPQDDRSNYIADVMDVEAVNDLIIVLTAVGGTAGAACRLPQDDSPGCYRLKITATKRPLALDGFSDMSFKGKLPPNGQEYSRLFREPNGSYILIGHYFKPTPQNFGSDFVPAGMLAYSIPLDASEFQ